MHAHRTTSALVLVLSLFAGSAGAETVTLDFEDAGGALPAQYGGFSTWSNVYVRTANNSVYYANSDVSGGRVAYSAGQSFIEDADPFDFGSMWVKSVYANGVDLKATAYNGGQFVGSVTNVLNATDGPQLLTFNWEGITKLVFQSSLRSDAVLFPTGIPVPPDTNKENRAMWTMDDFTFSQAQPVPLPAAAWGGLVLMGMVGANRLRRRGGNTAE